ncbi:MAG: hypothetical protein JXK16_00205 [Thiotrichales bacterium]|nr:hypothetical protein [Thiotrichales bacterium]
MSNAFHKIPPFLVVLLGGILLFFLMLMMSPNRENLPESELPWNSKILENGNVSAIGLITNQTTVLEAQRFFKDDITVKLFSKKDESNKSAEVFFPSIHIGTIHAAMVLKLNVDEKTLEEIYSRGVKTSINESGNREVTPSQEDDLFLKNQTFSLLTLIPRKSLPEDSIKKRFGEPERIEKQSDGLNHWFYPQKGLELIFDPEGPEALQYYALH